MREESGWTRYPCRTFTQTNDLRKLDSKIINQFASRWIRKYWLCRRTFFVWIELDPVPFDQRCTFFKSIFVCQIFQFTCRVFQATWNAIFSGSKETCKLIELERRPATVAVTLLATCPHGLCFWYMEKRSTWNKERRGEIHEKRSPALLTREGKRKRNKWPDGEGKLHCVGYTVEKWSQLQSGKSERMHRVQWVHSNGSTSREVSGEQWRKYELPWCVVSSMKGSSHDNTIFIIDWVTFPCGCVHLTYFASDLAPHGLLRCCSDIDWWIEKHVAKRVE